MREWEERKDRQTKRKVSKKEKEKKTKAVTVHDDMH